MGKFSSLLLGALSGAAAAYFLTSKKGKETTEKVRDFVKGYQENPDDVHEAVVKSAKDFSNQAVTVINQTKEKVENGEITTETVIESVKDATKTVVDYSQDKIQEIKGRFDKDASSEDVVFTEEEAPAEEELYIEVGKADPAEEASADAVQEEEIVIDLDSEAAAEAEKEKEE